MLCHWTTNLPWKVERGGGLADFEIQSPVSELVKEGFGHHWEARGSVRLDGFLTYGLLWWLRW